MGALEGSTVLIIWLALIGLMWWWMSRRRKSQEVARQSFLQSLREGDEVVTVGGIYGTIEAVHGDLVRLKIADGVTIRLHRMGINVKADE